MMIQLVPVPTWNKFCGIEYGHCWLLRNACVWFQVETFAPYCYGEELCAFSHDTETEEEMQYLYHAYMIEKVYLISFASFLNSLSISLRTYTRLSQWYSKAVKNSAWLGPQLTGTEYRHLISVPVKHCEKLKCLCLPSPPRMFFYSQRKHVTVTENVSKIWSFFWLMIALSSISSNAAMGQLPKYIFLVVHHEHTLK